MVRSQGSSVDSFRLLETVLFCFFFFYFVRPTVSLRCKSYSNESIRPAHDRCCPFLVAARQCWRVPPNPNIAGLKINRFARPTHPTDTTQRSACEERKKRKHRYSLTLPVITVGSMIDCVPPSAPGVGVEFVRIFGPKIKYA